MSSQELDALLVQMSGGDNAAFEKLYAVTKRGVYAFLYTYFHNAADTEDGMQTVYLKVKKGIHTYKAGSNASAWLLQIAKNYALSVLSKRRLEASTDEIEVPYHADFNEGTVADAMQRVLTEEEQRIVTLHVIWEYKHREIGEMLGCPTGTITSKYKRAIEKLQNALKEVEK